MRILDSHVHIGLNDFMKHTDANLAYNLENSYRTFLDIMIKYKVEKSIILPIPVQECDIIQSHRYLLEAAQNSGNKMVPLCRFYEDLWYGLGCFFNGVKYHMVYETKIQRSKFALYLKTLEFYDYPLLVHAKFKDKIKQIKDILSIAPQLKIVLAHMGRGHLYTSEGVLENVEGLKPYENVFFETSTVGNSDTIREVVNIVGSSRVMFGSDYPFGKVFFKKLNKKYSYGDELNVILNTRLSGSNLDNIFYNTAANIFRINDDKPKICITPIKSEYVESVKDLLDCLPKEEKNFLAYEKKRVLIRKSIKEGKHVYVLIVGTKIAGYMRESGRYEGTSMLEELVVFEPYRGKGYADYMIEYYKKIFPKAYAKTNAANVKMNTIMKKHGFSIVSGTKIFNWEI